MIYGYLEKDLPRLTLVMICLNLMTIDDDNDRVVKMVRKLKLRDSTGADRRAVLNQLVLNRSILVHGLWIHDPIFSVNGDLLVLISKTL